MDQIPGYQETVFGRNDPRLWDQTEEQMEASPIEMENTHGKPSAAGRIHVQSTQG